MTVFEIRCCDQCQAIKAYGLERGITDENEAALLWIEDGMAKNGLMIGIGNNMKTRKIGDIWKVWFLDCEGNIQTAEHKRLQMALSMAFINRTTVLGVIK